MTCDRDLFFHIHPLKYHNDAYDMVNLFYGGTITHIAVMPGKGRMAEIFSAGADCITAVVAGGRFEITYMLHMRGGSCVCESLTEDCPVSGSVAYALKMALYRKLAALSGCGLDSATPLPWGALVGIRPIKKYAEMLRFGMTPAQATERMTQQYCVPRKTSELCMQIATAQEPILRKHDPERDYMLYIGVPFCVSKCAYCSFPSDAHNKADIYAAAYVDAILREINFTAGFMKGAGRRLVAVYVGGGTPTALGARELGRLLYGAMDAFNDGCPDEITVEAGRPDTIDSEKLAIIMDASRSAATVRLCINPQSMNANTLELIGRRHTPGDIVDSFRLARAAGFNNINMDIIAGLPGEDPETFAYTLESVAKLRPESVTAHTLCIKRSSRLNEFTGAWRYPDAAEVAAMQEAASEHADLWGMRPYYLYRQKNTIGHLANTGYALEGCECIYNIHEMADSLDVLAVGAGAASKFVEAGGRRVERVFNVKNLLEYINRADEMIGRKKHYLTTRSSA